MNMKLRHVAFGSPRRTLIATIVLVAAGVTLIAARPVRLKPTPTFSVVGTPSNASQTIPIYHIMNEVGIIVQPLFDRFTRSDVDTGIAAFMQATNAGSPLTIRVAATTSFTAPWNLAPPLDMSEFHTSPQQIGFFTQTGDPVLAANPSSSSSTFHPRRVYLAGTMWTPNSEDQIGVWYTDGTPSSAWTAYPGIAFNDVQPGSPNANYMDDKPAIAVSEYSNTAGWVYLAFIRAPIVNAPPGLVSTFQVWRLGDGAQPDTWHLASTPVTGSSTNAPVSPRLDVDPATGTLYLSWVDWLANTVSVLVSPSGLGDTGTWLGPYTKSTSQLVTHIGSDSVCSPSGTGCFPSGRSFLSTRFNPADSSLAIVYHRRKGTTGAEVVMRRFNYQSMTPFTDERVVSSRTGDNQWHGTVACAPSGTCLVTYYDYASGEGGYRVYGRKVQDDGTPIEGEQLLYSSAAYSDPSHFYNGHLEYQDIFYRNGTWYPAFLYGSSAESLSDAYVARVQ